MLILIEVELDVAVGPQQWARVLPGLRTALYRGGPELADKMLTENRGGEIPELVSEYEIAQQRSRLTAFLLSGAARCWAPQQQRLLMPGG